MTNRDNFMGIARRTGYEFMPVDFQMCPSLREKYEAYCRETGFHCEQSYKRMDNGARLIKKPDEAYLAYYDCDFKPGTVIDSYGVAHEPGSAAAMHMTKMHHPMERFDSPRQVLEYPFPAYDWVPPERPDGDTVYMGNMQCTVWEAAWYLRGMEQLMMDMMEEEEIATVLLDKVTELSIANAVAYAKAGADCIFLGDDIGMQRTIMMSEELYCDWLKPRIKRVIDEARQVKPDVLIFYHSCGFITPFLPHLIEVGVDVLNPLQPECMDFAAIHSEFGGAISFHGTIGTQSVMPFGSPDDVRREVRRNLDIAGPMGGLFAAPTHLLEPEVPVENVVAYVEACRSYRS